jgi:hypothetical protein
MEWVLVPLLSAIAAGVIGRMKGSSVFIWTLVGLGLPVIGPIAALLYRNENDEPRRRCPQCGAVHKIHVQVCTHCGLDMDLPADEDVIPGRA